MLLSNDDLWREENKSRRSLLKRIILMLLAVTVLILVLAAWLTQPLILTPSWTQSEVNVEPARLEAHVRKLSEEFYPRNHLNLTNLNKAADYIKAEFETAGGAVSEQTFLVNGAEYRNISVLIGPATNERIVIGAHYDSAFDTPGADDNASGIAGLIELAHLFGKHPPPLQIELVAYTLEEPPFFALEQMGSFSHASSLKERGINIRLMICLEMIGYFSDEPNSQAFPLSVGRLLYPMTGNFIAIVGNFTNGLTVRRFKKSMSQATTLPVYSINAPAFVPGVDFSDHRSYWKAGFEAVMITDSAFYRNKNYHTRYDTAETLNYPKLTDVIKATYNGVLQAAK
jgi:Zn-dependent M28 family amino/carboxypeptidase